MTNLYLTEQGATVRKTGKRLIVEKEGQELLEIECFKLDTLFLFGNIQITTQAITQILANNIELAFFSFSGRLKGQVTPPMPKNVLLRMAQYEKSQNQDVTLVLARILIAAKIENSRRFLARHHRNKPEVGFDKIVKNLENDLAKVRMVDSQASLLGLEGDSARTYFRGIALACTGSLAFRGRKRRPPPDPVNALLSFGYTLVAAEIASLMDGMGFDPYIGLFHQPRYGRTSLALDLLEEFRVDAVDRLVLNLVNRNILSLRHFQDLTSEGRGFRLTRDGLKKFFNAYERHLLTEIPTAASDRTSTLRSEFRFQTQKLAKTLTEDLPYAPFQRA